MDAQVHNLLQEAPERVLTIPEQKVCLSVVRALVSVLIQPQYSVLSTQVTHVRVQREYLCGSTLYNRPKSQHSVSYSLSTHFALHTRGAELVLRCDRRPEADDGELRSYCKIIAGLYAAV